MKIIQIKGSNGAGKSTIPLQMMAHATDVQHVVAKATDGVVLKYTVLDDLGWTLIGKYHLDGSPTANGCDSLGKIDTIKRSIAAAMEYRPLHNILMEGMMVSTIKSTFYNLFLELEAERDDIQPIFVILQTSTEGCLTRLTARGTRKTKLNVGNVAAKCRIVVAHAKTYDQKYVVYMPVDQINKRDMLSTFLQLVQCDDPFLLEDEWYPSVEAAKRKEIDVEVEMDLPTLSYMDVIKMKRPAVEVALAELYDGDEAYAGAEMAEMNELELRRTLILERVKEEAIDRSDVVPAKGTDPTLFAPWCFRATRDRPVYERQVGYCSSSKHNMSLLVMVHQFHRDDVPLVSEWEQVALCRDCKGAGGACPGLAPRFDTLRPKDKWLNVVTVSMDYAWALEFGSRKSWYMLSSYIDMITVSYINRITDALATETGAYMVGAHNCPGKCKDCIALKTGKCGRKKRRYSMEAVGIDCDYLHYMMFGEYMPWGYKGHEVAPTYMTRYAGWMSDARIKTDLDSKVVRSVMNLVVKTDKTYIPLEDVPADDVAAKYSHIINPFTVPVGQHKGCSMMAYYFKKLEK